MSYDIELVDPVTGEVLKVDEPHQIRGGTYAVGGTSELRLNVTYNYSPHFYRLMGEEGIRSLYGKTGAEAIPILKTVISQLGDDAVDDYWKPTEGNAKRALYRLLALATMRPDGVFRGD